MKADIEKIQVSLNGARMKTGTKEITAPEARRLLQEAGIGNNVQGKFLDKVFIQRKEGTRRFYTFRPGNIHHDLIENIYKSQSRVKSKTMLLDEQSAVELLKSLGYKMSKPVGLDKDRMKKDGMYEKYMLYKTILLGL